MTRGFGPAGHTMSGAKHMIWMCTMVAGMVAVTVGLATTVLTAFGALG